MRFVLAVLATWRVTHLLASEDGPGDLIFRFRKLLGENIAGKLMDCFYCLSFWIAAPAALFVSSRPIEWLFSWLALSGGVVLLERLVKEPAAMEGPARVAEEEVNDVLRSEAVAVTEQFDPEAGAGRESVAARR